MKIGEITKIKHPIFVLTEREVDLLTSKLCFGSINVFNRTKNKALRIIRKLYEM